MKKYPFIVLLLVPVIVLAAKIILHSMQIGTSPHFQEQVQLEVSTHTNLKVRQWKAGDKIIMLRGAAWRVWLYAPLTGTWTNSQIGGGGGYVSTSQGENEVSFPSKLTKENLGCRAWLISHGNADQVTSVSYDVDKKVGTSWYAFNNTSLPGCKRFDGSAEFRARVIIGGLTGDFSYVSATGDQGCSGGHK